MAQPETLYRRMSDMDRLVLRCRACDARYVATRAQAMKRFGERATSYHVEQTARCPDCRSREIDVAIAGPLDDLAAPSRNAISFADVKRLDLSLHAYCARCNIGLAPSPRALAAHRRQPLAQVFEEHLVVCHVCGFPVCGLSVERPHRRGGGQAETVHAWWEPGSPADPVVLAFWARLRASLPKR